MKRKSSLYLSFLQRKSFINDIEEMRDIFHEKLYASVDCDFESELTEYERKLHEEYISTAQTDSDRAMGDVEFDLSEIESKLAKRYFLLKTTQYRMIAMWICCLCEVWEQQLQIILKLEYENGDLLIKSIPDKWAEVKKIYFEHTINFEEFPDWKTLDEMRLLVNVIKHGEGFSEEKLRQKRPELFMVNDYDGFSIYHSALITQTLNLNKADIDKFSDCIIEFWKHYPTDKYCCKD